MFAKKQIPISNVCPRLKLSGLLCVILLGIHCMTAAANGASTFAKSNLHVWAFEEYDAVKRTPEDRALLLKELGITKAGYICRNAARVAEFEAYVQAYKKEGIELIAVWTPVKTENPFEEPQISAFLDVAERNKLTF